MDKMINYKMDKDPRRFFNFLDVGFSMSWFFSHIKISKSFICHIALKDIHTIKLRNMM